jgi:hypothetical protein
MDVGEYVINRLPLALLALASLAVSGWAAVTIQVKDTRYWVYTGIRPAVVFCIDGVCSYLTPAEAKHIASALTIAAAEQEAKK